MRAGHEHAISGRGFAQIKDEDEKGFGAVKPWAGAINAPTRYAGQRLPITAPDARLAMTHVSVHSHPSPSPLCCYYALVPAHRVTHHTPDSEFGRCFAPTNAPAAA